VAKINVVFDASMLDMFRLCECRYNYAYNLHIRLPEKAAPLDRGTLVHIGNEVYYEALKNGVKYQDAVNAALSKIREAGVILTDLNNEVISRVVDVMEEYYDYWRVDDQRFQIVSVEQPFIYLLYEDDDIRIHMAGKIDLLINDNQYTNLPYDHKSYDRAWDTHRMSNQFKNYCYATKSNYLRVNKIGFQKTLKPHEKFIRVPLSYDPLILEEWKNNIVKVVMHYLTCVAENSWPMNETSCDKFNRRCDYFRICDSSGLAAKNYKINSDYIQVEPWDVTKVMRKASQILDDERSKKEANANG